MSTPIQRARGRHLAQLIRTQAPGGAIRLSASELLELANAYLAEVGDGTDGAFRRQLGEEGQVYVTLAAARQYGEAEDVREEEARRELTELLLEAKGVEGRPDQWRYRSQSSQLDVLARVSPESPLLVVTHVSVRATGERAPRRAGAPKPAAKPKPAAVHRPPRSGRDW